MSTNPTSRSVNLEMNSSSLVSSKRTHSYSVISDNIYHLVAVIVRTEMCLQVLRSVIGDFQLEEKLGVDHVSLSADWTRNHFYVCIISIVGKIGLYWFIDIPRECEFQCHCINLLIPDHMVDLVQDFRYI